LLVASVHHEQVTLGRVAREVDGPDGAALVRQLGGAGANPQVALETPELVEDLDAIALPVTDVQQTSRAHGDAMHDLRKRCGHAGASFLRRRLPAPLAQKFSGAVEHRDPAIAVAIRNVNVTVARIDDDACGLEETAAARVARLAIERTVDAVDDATHADL